MTSCIEIWHEKLDEVKLFLEINGRIPSKTTKDCNEKVLSIWIETQVENKEKCQHIMLNEEIRDIWDAFKNEHIEYFKSNEKIWREKLEEAKSFFEIHGKRPSKHANGEEEEKVLGFWIDNQLKNREKRIYIMSNEEIRDIWDGFKNDYETYLIDNVE